MINENRPIGEPSEALMMLEDINNLLTKLELVISPILVTRPVLEGNTKELAKSEIVESIHRI